MRVENSFFSSLPECVSQLRFLTKWCSWSFIFVHCYCINKNYCPWLSFKAWKSIVVEISDEQTECVQGHKDLLQKAAYKEIGIRNMTVLEDSREIITKIVLYLTIFVSCALGWIIFLLMCSVKETVRSFQDFSLVIWDFCLPVLSNLNCPDTANTLH